MSDTPPREGSRLGPYLLGRRHPDSDPALGHIYEAHHIESGAPALVIATLGGVALVMGLLLWSRTPAPKDATLDEGEVETVSGESVSWVDLAASTRPIIGYPLPSKPFKGQHKPPCTEGAEVEINGGCWAQLKQDAPCPRTTAEHQGKCYMPVRDPPPEPRSLRP